MISLPYSLKLILCPHFRFVIQFKKTSILESININPSFSIILFFVCFFVIIEENKRAVIIKPQGRAMVEKSSLINCENNKNLKSKLFSTFIELAIYIALSL